MNAITLHSDFMTWEHFRSPECVLLFVWLLLNADENGQVVTTYKAICEGTGLSEQRMRTAVKKLVATRKATQTATCKNTVLTVCDYARYKGENFASNVNCNVNCNVPTKEKKVAQKKENNNIYTTTTTARTREEEYISRMKEEAIWLEAVAKNFNADPIEIKIALDQFSLDAQCRARTHESLGDAKRHFNDWLRIRRSRRAKVAVDTKRVNDLWQ